MDIRIEPLREIFAGFEAGIAAIEKRLDNEEWFDGISAREYSEPLFGAAFVVCQVYAVGTVSDLNAVAISRGKSPKDKRVCYACDTTVLKGGVTRLQLIYASANYFKHHEEWPRWPTGKDPGIHDIKTLAAVGITEKTEFRCIEAIELLCGPSWDLAKLHQIMKEWRAHVFATLL